MRREYQVGDIVQIVDSPVECKSGWVRTMDQYCGKTARILHADTRYDTYRIDLDNAWHCWNSNCFVEIVDLPDIFIDTTLL